MSPVRDIIERMRGWPVLLLCAGCDLVIPLEERPTSPDCAGSIDHDEDGDGVLDDCDPCPFLADNGVDEDDDGISGRCDPEPGVRNERLLFTGFGPGNLAAFTVTGGAGTANDAWQVNGEGGYLLWAHAPLDQVWVMAGVEVQRLNDLVSYREVGVIVDGKPSAASEQPAGTYCSSGMSLGGTTYVDIYARDRDRENPADVSVTSGTPTFPLTDLRPGTIKAWHDHAGPTYLSCQFSIPMADANIGGTPAPLVIPAPGTVGLFATSVDAAFPYLFVVGRAPAN